MSSLLGRWDHIIDTMGDRTAIIGFPEEATLSFRQVDAMAEAKRELLRSELTDPSSKIVAVQLDSRIDWMISFLAVLKAGAIFLPIDVTSTEAECQRLLDRTGCNARFNKQGFQRLRARAHPQLKRAGVRCFKVTSGSTSVPKVLPFTEPQMMADATNILETMEITAADVHFATIPLGHSYGLGSLVVPFVMQGIPLVFNSIPLPGIIARELSISGATVMPTIPGILKALAQSESTQLPSCLRLVISAASPLTPELVHAFDAQHDLRIHNFYGSSETGGIAYDTTGHLLTDSGAVGVPLRNVEVSISKSGRVRVCSDAVQTVGNPNHHHNRGVQLLADFGRLEHDGLQLIGRSNRIVKHNGKRLDLAQIERILMEHDAVQDAFVAYDESRHRVIAAIVGSIETPEFCKFASRHLAVWKRPKVIWSVSALPMTARGKPDRSAILAGISSHGKKLQY